jgi:hypothetical protein
MEQLKGAKLSMSEVDNALKLEINKNFVTKKQTLDLVIKFKDELNDWVEAKAVIKIAYQQGEAED